MSQIVATIEPLQAKYIPTFLPDGWQRVRLADVCDEVYRYPSFYGFEHRSQGVPVIRGEHINSRGEISTDWNRYWFISSDTSKNFPRTVLREGDLVFTVRGTIGKVGIVRSSHVGAQISPNLIRISPSSKIYSDFLWYYLHTIKGTEDAVKDNAVTIATVRASDLLELSIPLPLLSEQKRIAAILKEQMSAVEQARAAAEAQLEAAKYLPTAYLLDAFNSSEALFWIKRSIGDVATLVQNGIYKSAEHYGHGQPFLRMYNVPNNSWELNLDRLALVNLDDKEKQSFSVKCGDLLISRVNSIELVGKCAWVRPDAEGFAFENMLIRVRLDESVNSLFVSQQMGTERVRNQFQTVAKRAIGQASINSADLRGIEIVLPPKALQNKIADELTVRIRQAKQASTVIKNQLAAIEKLPAALLRQAFTGKL